MVDEVTEKYIRVFKEKEVTSYSTKYYKVQWDKELMITKVVLK
jgi:hypothetical protein